MYRDGVTQGSIGLFLQCREQFRLKMIEGLSHRAPSEAIEFGSAFHAMLADIHGFDWSIPRAAKSYLQLWQRGKSVTPAELEKINFIVETVSSTLKYYLPQWERDDKKKKGKWIVREKVFRVPVDIGVTRKFTRFGAGLRREKGLPMPTPETAEHRVEIILTGRWDGIFAPNKKTNTLFETKTKSQIDEDGIMDMLPFDLQTMLYCFAGEQAFGKKMSGTIYDVIRRPGLRQGSTETLSNFLGRIDQDIKSRPAHYFKRYQVNLDASAVSRFLEHQLKPILRDMVNWYEDLLDHLDNPWESPSHYMCSNNLFTRFGKCDVFAAITRGSRFGLYRRQHPYPELID